MQPTVSSQKYVFCNLLTNGISLKENDSFNFFTNDQLTAAGHPLNIAQDYGHLDNGFQGMCTAASQAIVDDGNLFNTIGV